MSTAFPEDATLARLATEAGLCVAHCWDIDLLLDPTARQEDADWVAAASGKEHQRRQDVHLASRARATEALAKLRRFAELIAAHQEATNEHAKR